MAVAILLLWLACSAFAQTPPERPSFDVVSVKRTPVERRNQLKSERCNSGGAYVVEGTPLLWSIQFAYRLKDAEIAAVPGWLESFDDAYDITGKSAGPVTDEQCRLMVQSLLEDRFHLKLHRETRERPVYFLKVVKNGPKLQEVHTDSPDLGGVRFNGRHPAYLSEKESPPGWPMSRLASYLADLLNDDRWVIDETSLTGIYAFNLEYSKDGVDHPPLVPALRDQLGLQLEPGKKAVEITVIDHIERPTEN
jgi:uncharacterized protein (TIGR03435 family)